VKHIRPYRLFESTTLTKKKFRDRTEWRNPQGDLHREDGPAIEYKGGSKEWWVDGKRHREDGPAVEYAYGSKAWFLKGKPHRADGPAVEWADGSKEWWVDGQRHRLDGPAIEYASGGKAWWVDGQRHREDGPAVEHSDGSKEWWVNDRKLEAGEFYRRRFEQLGDSADLQFLNQLEELVDAGLAQWSTPAIVGELENRLKSKINNKKT
jgi:hypothetical protein